MKSSSSATLVQQQTPYGGLVPGKNTLARTAPHLLVSGPTGQGKSRRVLAPGILMWQGPVVAVSSKPDLVQLCLTQRLTWDGHGRTYVIDLSGEIPDEALPEGVEKVAVDPTALVRTDDDALDMASILLSSGAAGASEGKGDGAGDAFWTNLATAPLAAILRAASERGIGWAREAVSRIAPTEDEDGEDHGDEMEEPSWASAAQLLVEMGSEMLAQELEAVVALDGKMRDSVAITMKSAVAPWLRSTVASPGATVFTPTMLEHPRATLFMVAPASGVAAGAAVATVDFITKRWRANQTEEVTLPRLLLVVDELTNTMPWPKLPVVVTESRAMGINLLVAVQATSQLAKRYGTQGMNELREVFPATLCLVGAAEKEMLEHAAWWYGHSQRQNLSVDHHGRQSQSAERVETMRATDLLPKSKDEGRLLRGSDPTTTGEDDTIAEAGLLVSLPDISKIPFDYRSAG